MQVNGVPHLLHQHSDSQDPMQKIDETSIEINFSRFSMADYQVLMLLKFHKLKC